MAKAKVSKNAPPPLPRVAQFLTDYARWIVVGLLALFVFTAWSAVREKSTTFDEMAHLTAGTAYWKTGDFRLHPENGILPQRLETLPLVLMGVKFPDTNQAAWWTSNVWTLGYQYFYSLGNNLDRMLWWARGTIVAMGVVLGLIVYAWSRRLFGVVGGLVSLAAYVLCPNILANTALATSDVTATLMFVAALGAFWIVLHRVTPGTVALSAVMLGLLFVSKMSAVLILPIAVLLLALRLFVGRPLLVKWRQLTIVRGRLRQFAILASVMMVQAITTWAMIWLLFGFHYETFRTSELGRDKMYYDATIDNLTDEGALGPILHFAYDKHLLPQAYVHGFAFTLEFSQARTAYMNGERSQTGWRTFFPYAFLVKTPLPTMGLFAVAMWAAVASWTAVRGSPEAFRPMIRRRVVRGLYRTAPLWLFIVVYWIVAIRSNLNIGHRHVLPTYPLMFILCGAAGYWLLGRSKVPRWLVVVFLAWLALESLTMYPNYLAYFNELVGGPQYGYRHLVDSSLDWGQDLPALKKWLAKQDLKWRDRPVYLSYFGTGSPKFYGIKADVLPGYPGWDRNAFFNYEPGTYCISATMLPCIYIRPWSAWNDEYEQLYQQNRATVAKLVELQRRDPGAYERMVADPTQAAQAKAWSETLQQFDELRFARLAAYLSRREPDDEVGHSILIYHLDAADLNAALSQPTENWK